MEDFFFSPNFRKMLAAFVEVEKNSPLVLKPGCKVQIRVLKGALWIFNYLLHPTETFVTIESSKYSSCLVLESSHVDDEAEGEGSTLIEVQSCDGTSEDGIQSCFMRLEEAMENGGSSFLSFPPSWHNICQGLQQGGKAAVGALVMGNKNVGKSSLSRFLINGILGGVAAADNSMRSVVYLVDLDSGQPEFTPSGVISLARIAKPMLSSETDSCADIIYSLSVGSCSPKDFPKSYLSASMHLLDLASTLVSIDDDDDRNDDSIGRQFVIVNTPGWTKGLGLEYLKAIQSHPLFTHCILVGGGEKCQKVFDSLLSSRSLLLTNSDDIMNPSSASPLLWSADASPVAAGLTSRSQNFDIRNHKLMAYLATHERSSLVVSLQNIAVLCLSPLPPHKILHALNGSLVSLLHVPGLELNPAAGNIVNFIPETCPFPVSEWMGYGVVAQVLTDDINGVVHLKIINCPSDMASRINCICLSRLVSLPTDFITRFNDDDIENLNDNQYVDDGGSMEQMVKKSFIEYRIAADGQLGARSKRFRGNLMRKVHASS